MKFVMVFSWCGLFWLFGFDAFALQVTDSTRRILPQNEHKIAKKSAQKLSKVQKILQKSQKIIAQKFFKSHKRKRTNDWLRDFYFKLGMVLLFLLGAAIIGAFMAYGKGTLQFIGRYLFGLFLGLLVLGLGIALVEGDGIGRMAWLTAGFLMTVFAVACPEEFEIFLQILELLGEF